MSTRTCPTCSQPTRGNEGLVQTRIASRPDSGPAQARHITNLERQLAEAREGLEQALAHCEELRVAWGRGMLRESSGQGGTRSNRNVEVVVSCRAILGEKGA